MSKKLFTLFFLLLFVCLTAPRVFAWDDTGHKLTAYIAWETMTPQAREKAFKVLMSAPEDSDLNVFYLQDSRAEAVKKMELFMIASTWADIVRDRKFPVRYGKYHKGNWHYADTFWTGANGQIKVLPQPAGEDGGQAIIKIKEFDKVLRDASAKEADKSIALAWILHLVGDIHQPLHTSARITPEEPKGDQGGNLFLLSPASEPRETRLNLHWFWDSIVGRVIERQGVSDDVYLPFIARQFMQKYPAQEMQSRLKAGQFDEWQQEGVKLTQTKVFTANLKRGEAPSSVYRRESFDLAEEQIALAGYRMGAMLNQIFAQ